MADEFKKRAIARALPALNNPTVLDLGCGSGDYTRFLKEKHVNVLSVDLEKTDAAPTGFSVADAIQLPFQDKSFDSVIGFDVFEHVPEVDKALNEVKRVLKDDGMLLASVPNDSIIPRLYFTLTMRKPPSRDDTTHVRFNNYLKWHKLFCQNFKIKRKFGQWFTEGGSKIKPPANTILSRFYRVTPNIYFLLGK